MKWQQIKKYLIGSSIGIVTLFSALFLLTGVDYTYTGDIECEETCESYINVTTTYWRMCFDSYEGTKYEDETLFKKQTRSRTLHVNLDKVDNIISTEPEVVVDWMVPTYGKKWRPIKNGDCWERGKVNKIKLVGHKEADQTVKWSFDLGDKVNVDPLWIGNTNSLFIDSGKIGLKYGGLEVNTTLRKMDSKSFIEPTGNVWTKGLKFGFNDTTTKENTLYQYEWKSNQPIKFDGYYYFDEKYMGKTGVSNIYRRRRLDVSDICTENASCVYSLEDNNTKLLINFIGFYNETLDMIFIDPSFSYTDISTEATLVTNVRSEAPFSHLSTAFNESLVLYMPMDYNDSTGNVYDYSVNDNDGVMSGFGDNWTREGIIGGAYEFSGDSILTADNIYSESTFSAGATISAWVKVSGLDDNDRIMGIEGRFELHTHSTDGFEVELYDGSYYTANSSDVSDYTNWHHVVGVWNTTDILLYIDASLKNTSSASNFGTIDAVTRPIHIGADWSGGDNFFDGTIDEVMIFNRSLSAFEVGQLYNYTFQKFYTQGNQNFTVQNYTLGNDNKLNLTIKAEALNDSSFNAKIWESSDNSTFIDSANGTFAFTTLNSTHLRAHNIVLTGAPSTFIYPEIIYLSTNGFYSSILEKVVVDTYEVSGADTTPPTWTGNQTNNTVANVFTEFGLLVNDNVALEPNGGYIFSTNNSGVWDNDSFVLFTSTPEWANVTKMLPANAGNRTDYMWFLNDTENNLNSTDMFFVVTTSAIVDTCSPSSPLSANHIFDCSDYCNETSNLDAAGFNVSFINTGIIDFKSNVTHIDYLFVWDGCVINTWDNIGGFQYWIILLFVYGLKGGKIKKWDL